MKPRHYISLSLAVIIIAGSFFLPNAVAAITDMRRLDNLIYIDSERISFDTVPELALSERLALAGNASMEMLPLNTGNAMNNESAAQTALDEIARFFSGGAFLFDYSAVSIGEGSASLIIDISDPTRYMIVWEFEIVDADGNMVTAIIDDETGIIVRLIYRLGNREGPLSLFGLGTPLSNDELFHTAAARLTEMMAEYYGLSVVLADYEFSGTLSYYRADVIEAGQTISLYGVVRTASFTMNERV